MLNYNENISNADDKVKKFKYNMVSTGSEISSDYKSIRDKNTHLVLSECQDDYNLYEKLGLTANTADNGPACSHTDKYAGACWVEPLFFSGGKHKIRVCNHGTIGYAECHDLAAGEINGHFAAYAKMFDYVNTGYGGGYKPYNDTSDCPDTTANMNALGYTYLYEATDPTYQNNDFDKNFINTFCKKIEESFNPNNCEASSFCPCESESCKRNNFIPNKNSKEWKNMSQSVKNCYSCLQNYRASHFYCRKIFNCLNKDRTENAVYNFLTNDLTRPFAKQMYGVGNYLCGYYRGILCGCAKSKLPAGPRHFQRIIYEVNEEDCIDKEGLQKNPQCNLFDVGVYVRQFRNETIETPDAVCEKDRTKKAELGYKKRGTFFSPKLTVVAGENERVISFDSNIFDPEIADFYYNQPIGEYQEYDNNNVYGFPTAKKIVFGNFYPVIYEIGNKYRAVGDDGKCVYKPTGNINYIMLRWEYNVSTSNASLVAYKIRFVDSLKTILTDGKRLKSDGSFMQFVLNSANGEKNASFINLVKEATNTITTKLSDRKFIYSEDPDQNFPHKNMPIKGSGKILLFENIGKVTRPPLKYSYDEGSKFINSPIVLKEDVTAMANSDDLRATILKISVVPGNLSSFEGDEFKSDKQLPAFTKQVKIAGYRNEIFTMSGGANTSNNDKLSQSSSAIIFGKRFSVGYSNPCVYLKLVDESFLNSNMPTDISECTKSTLQSVEKLHCFTSFALHNECQGYISCLRNSTSIGACQNEGRTPNMKITGNDNTLIEYKKNTDFRSKTFVCITEGFDFADKLSDMSNTKLFGSFGDPKYDYTIRWKKNENGAFARTLNRPVTKHSIDTVNKSTEPQDEPKYLIDLNDDYFSGSPFNRDDKILRILRTTSMIDGAGLPSDINGYDFYASDCDSSAKLCSDRFEVSHRAIHETFSNLCVDAGTFNSGKWALPARDLGIDYHVYIPLRCQYLSFKGIGAGGAGFTSYGTGYESNGKAAQGSNCLAHWHWTIATWGLAWYILAPWPFPCTTTAPVFFNIPKFDGTGASGSINGGVVDILKLPIFDGYFSVSIGARTTSKKGYTAGQKRYNYSDYCFIGPSPFGNVAKNTGRWDYEGGSHKHWWSDGVYDYRKGKTELAFDNHDKVANEVDYTKDYKDKINRNYGLIDGTYLQELRDKTNKIYNDRMSYFYYIHLKDIAYRLYYIDDALHKIKIKALNKVKNRYIEQSNIAKNKYENIAKLQQAKRTLNDLNEEKNKNHSEREMQQIEQNIADTESEIIRLENLLDYQNDVSDETLAEDYTTYKNQYDDLMSIINNNAYDKEEIRSEKISNTEIDNFYKYLNDYKTKEYYRWFPPDMYSDNEKHSLDNEKRYLTDLASSIGYSVFGEGVNVFNLSNEYKLNLCLNDFDKNICNKYENIIREEYNRVASEVQRSLNDKKTIINNLPTYNEKESYVIEDLEELLISLQNYYETIAETMKTTYSININYIDELYQKSKKHNKDVLDKVSSPNYADLIEAEHGCNYYHLRLSLCSILENFEHNCTISSAEYAHKNECGLKGLSNNIIIQYDGKISFNQVTNCVFENGVKCNEGQSGCMCYDDKNIVRNHPLQQSSQILENEVDAKFKRIVDLLNDNCAAYRMIAADQEVSRGGVTSHEVIFRTSRGHSAYDDRAEQKTCAQSLGACFNPSDMNQISGTYDSMCTLSEWFAVCAKIPGLLEINVDSDFISKAKDKMLRSATSAWASIGSFTVNDRYLVNKSYQYIEQLGTPMEISKNLTKNCDINSTYQWESGYYRVSGPNASNSTDDINGKNNLYERIDGAGGSFRHRGGTGAGGAGNVNLGIDIPIKQVFYQGDYYPVLNNNGTKIIDGNVRDQRCRIKCPPIFVVKKNFSLYFKEIQNSAMVDMLCEYSGSPEDDMELSPQTNYHPKKCYIMTESVPGVGNVKGKIFTSLNGMCPIAKCANGVWQQNDVGETVIGSIKPKTTQVVFDRKTGLCKPKSKYGTDKTNKSSWYYNMMFDKNIYSGMSYEGSRNSSLTSTIYQDERIKTYDIAYCSKSVADAYISDNEYEQLSSSDDLKLYCNANGFWERASDVNDNHIGNLGNFPVSSLYSEKSSDDDYKRNIVSGFLNSYTETNANMNFTEYLVRDTRYAFGKSDGYEFDLSSASKITTGIRSIDDYISTKMQKPEFGRIVFKNLVKCPMIDADRYDFDEEYSGNANWDFADEETNVVSLGCKTSANNVYIQQKAGPPTRFCKINGIWSSVVNPCLKGCDTITEDGIKWIVTSDMLNNLKGTSIEVSGACFGKYLNSQNVLINSNNNSDNTYKRDCNLLTGSWGEIRKENACEDNLVELEDNYKNVQISAPYARVLKYSSGNTYAALISGIEDGTYNLNKKTKYFDHLYLPFLPERYESSDFKDYTFYQTNTDISDNYVDVSYKELNIDRGGNNIYTKDVDGNLLIDNLGSGGGSYIIIIVKNAISPLSYSYMLAQGDSERNEFLNIENWLNNIKTEEMNFTGQWSWKANMNAVRSKGVYNSTKQEAQELYKNISLIVFLPNYVNDKIKNFKNISLFSPYLAKKYASDNNIKYNKNKDMMDNDEIRFRFPISYPGSFSFENIPVIIYNGIGASYRLYRFEWDKYDNQDWSQKNQTTHLMGKSCVGKYYGTIKHNTTKHIMYTDAPLSNIQTFASLYCYDGRIFGFHAFQTQFLQDIGLTDNNTKRILLSTNKNGDNLAYENYYNKKNEFDKDGKNVDIEYFSDENEEKCGLDDPGCGSAKNAYVAAMMMKYWSKHILPEKLEQTEFINNFNPKTDTHYTTAESPIVQKILSRYANGRDGYYYRVVERDAEWISGSGNKDEQLNTVYDIIDI